MLFEEADEEARWCAQNDEEEELIGFICKVEVGEDTISENGEINVYMASVNTILDLSLTLSF